MMEEFLDFLWGVFKEDLSQSIHMQILCRESIGFWGLGVCVYSIQWCNVKKSRHSFYQHGLRFLATADCSSWLLETCALCKVFLLKENLNSCMVNLMLSFTHCKEL